MSVLPSPRRVLAIAGVTLTQLIRMRLFLVLGIFALGILVLQFLPFHGQVGIEFAGAGQLELIKNVCLGAMSLFGIIFSVAATALLIPRDAEDRILYTILCKPVPRFDYLLGKALGVLGLLLLMLLVMDGLMCLILWLRHASLQAEFIALMQENGYTQADMVAPLQQLAEAGCTWNLQRGIAAMALGWCVLTSMTLLISCFTSGTIVSMVIGLGLYFVGMFQGQFLEALMASVGQGVSPTMQNINLIIGVLLPNFGLFTVGDATASGVPLGWGMLGSLALVAGAYALFHLLLATWLFSRKEF